MDDRHTPCTGAQLERYLARVGHRGALRPDAATLAALHEAHLGAIPFENLEIHRGRPMRIEPDALFEDLVDRPRGGYCFQMNELFARVLLAVGFGVERFAARVRLRNPLPCPPRSHQVLRVTAADGARFLADVGFGGGSPLRPLPWTMDRVDEQGIAAYRLVERDDAGVVVRIRPPREDWQDMLSFALEEQWPIDFEYANFAISTMPESLFVRHRIVARAEPGLRQTLFDATYRETRPDGVTERELDPDAEQRTLREVFGLAL